jgi:hypothetical protein
MTLGRVAWCALCLCACAEGEVSRLPAPIVDTVEVSAHPPGPDCWPLETVEVRSGKHDGSSVEALRLYAWRRAVNYVVLDTFSILDDSDENLVLMRARLYRCPALVRVQ